MNLIPPTGLDGQEIPADINSDVMSVGSFGANNDNLTYLGLRKHLPAIDNTTPDLSDIIKDARNILEVFEKVLANINALRDIFDQD